MDFKHSKIGRFLHSINEESWTFEYIAGFIAFMMYYPGHVALVSSRHMAVAFDIPEDTTGIYFTKLFSLRGVLILFGSLATYILKWFVSERNIIPTLIFASVMLISRICALILLHTSKNLALDIYNIYIFESISLGLFQLTFFTLTPDYVSLLSLCFKISKVTIFSIQLMMDLTIYEKPLIMVQLHFWIILILSVLATFLWFYYCFFKIKYKSTPQPKGEIVEFGEENTNLSYFNLLQRNMDESDTSCAFSDEPSFLVQIKNCVSPLLMSIVTLAMNNMISPGLLPYALLDRDKCHKINMASTPMGLAGCFLIHILKKNVDSVNMHWQWHWHLFWLFAIPPGIVFILTFVALHTDTALARAIYNSQGSVLVMALIFFFCHPLVETLGFVGVVSNVKHFGKVMDRGLKVISTNQFLGYIIGFISYKASVGYNVTRSLTDLHPAPNAALGTRIAFWIGSTFKLGFKDFINEVRMNIKEYI